MCSRCTRHGVSCSYRTVADASSSHRSTSYLPGVLDGLPGRENDLVQGNMFTMKDLALMHHWSLSASTSLSTAPWIQHIWQNVVPGIAFQYAYLMHGLLAIAALHVGSLLPTVRDGNTVFVDAAAHHNKSIRGFTEAMENINENNCNPIFLTSILNMFYVFATTGKDDSDDKLPNRLGVLDAEWIDMVRGCGAVLLPTYEEVSKGPLGGLLEIGDWSTLDPDENPSQDDSKLTELTDIWDSAQDKNHDTYVEALHCLRLTLKWMDDHSLSESKIYWAGPFIWLHIIPQDYLQLVRQRQPPALVLFAYFGVLVHRLDSFWWAQGWGRRIVTAIDGCLGSYWRPRIEWPLQKVRRSEYGK